MKKIYSLMFSCLLVSQVFPATNVVVEVAEQDAVVTPETQQQALQVIEKLQQKGLSKEEMLVAVNAALEENEDSTEGAYRSILSDRKIQERIVWMLVGAIVVIGIERLAWPYAIKPLIDKIRGNGQQGGEDDQADKGGKGQPKPKPLPKPQQKLQTPPQQPKQVPQDVMQQQQTILEKADANMQQQEQAAV